MAIRGTCTDQLPLGQLWIDALERADKGSLEETQVAVEAALKASGGGADFEAMAARLLLLANDFAGAVQAIARAEVASPKMAEAPLVLLARALVIGTLGDFAEAIVVLEGLASLEAPLFPLLAALELSASVAAPQSALRWAKRIAEHPAVRPEHLSRTADLLHRAGEDEAAITITRAVLNRVDAPGVDRGKAARLLLRCRACDDAADVFRRQIAEGADEAEAHLGLATIHLWRGETREADQRARQALARGESCPAARRVLAAVALLEGRADESLALLSSLVAELPGEAETRAWRAEALLRCGQPEAAHAEVRAATNLSHAGTTPNVALDIIDGLAALSVGRRPIAHVMLGRAVTTLCGEAQGVRVRRLARRTFVGRQLLIDRALAGASRWLRVAGVRIPEVDDPAAIKSILESALAQLGGNRTPATPTRISDGKLLPLAVEPSPRSEVAAALHSVRIGGYEEAYRRLTALMERYPEWPHPWFYRAELLMWVGRLEDAQRDLAAALAKKIRDPEIERGHWPRIGLAGVYLLQGRPHAALRTIDAAARRFGGPPAQPYFAWRGEILRALGRLDEARAMLEHVCPPGGCRLGSLITLALTCRDLGDRDVSRKILVQLAEQAPSLMIEVTRSLGDERSRLGTVATPATFARLSDDVARELLEGALDAMRGNRSASCLTFVDASNRLHAIPPGGVYRFVNRPDELKELHGILSTFQNVA